MQAERGNRLEGVCAVRRRTRHEMQGLQMWGSAFLVQCQLTEVVALASASIQIGRRELLAEYEVDPADTGLYLRKQMRTGFTREGKSTMATTYNCHRSQGDSELRKLENAGLTHQSSTGDRLRWPCLAERESRGRLSSSRPSTMGWRLERLKWITHRVKVKACNEAQSHAITHHKGSVSAHGG